MKAVISVVGPLYQSAARAALVAILGAALTVLSPIEKAHGQSDSTKYLDLVVGLDYYENFPNLPKDPEFRGDFRKLLKIAYDASTKQLRLTPKEKTGTCTLTIHDAKGAKVAQYIISIKKSNLNQIAREISNSLNEIEGIQIKIMNNRVVVDGEVLLPKDVVRIFTIVSQYGDMASSTVHLSAIAQKKIAEIIEREINNPEIHVRAVNDVFILEGMANDEDEKKQAELLTKTYVPDPFRKSAPGLKAVARAQILNLIKVKPPAAAEPAKIIQLIVHYVELKKDYTNAFRFQFTPSLSDNTAVNFQTGGSGAGGVVSSITGTISNLLPKLNWAKEHGHARVLESSSIIVEAGKQGKLKSVTRVPYQVLGPQGQPSTNFEEAGLVTNITPTMAGSDSVSLNIEFTIKALLGISNQGPLISSNDIMTIVTVRSGQSAAIGGLVSNSSGADYNKLPTNAVTNPLISLYASKDFRRDQSQFVVFVTPIIKSSASQGAEQIKKKFRLRD